MGYFCLRDLVLVCNRMKYVEPDKWQKNPQNQSQNKPIPSCFNSTSEWLWAYAYKVVAQQHLFYGIK